MRIAADRAFEPFAGIVIGSSCRWYPAIVCPPSVAPAY